MGGSRRRRPILTAALYVALLAAGVFAALQIHQAFRAPEAAKALGRSESLGPPVRWSSSRPSWTSPTSLPAGPIDLASSPLGAAGMRELSGDPRGWPAPPGARRRWAFERRSPVGIEQLATYDYTGEAEQAAQHYRSLLAGRGFRCREAPSDDKGIGELIFLKGRTRATVSLRQDAADATIVRITVTVLHWPQPGQAARTRD